jgi:predicted N-acetyltransferase YhbS
VAVDGSGLVVGFLLGARETAARSEVFCTQWVCVRPDAQQRDGVGGALLEELDRTLRALGVRSSYLITIRDRGLETFYERRGYRRDPRHVWMEHRIL